MKVWLGKLPNGDLRPLEPEKVRRLAIGEAVEFEFKLYRNIKFLRKFFALLKAVYEIEAIEQAFQSPEHLRYVLTIEAGYSEMVTSITGKVYLKAKSISFANMDDAEFDSLYAKVLDIVLDWLPNYVQDDLEEMQRRVLTFG